MKPEDFQEKVEVYRSANNAGLVALKSALLLNGGAAIAVLAFVSNLVQVNIGKVADVSLCLLIFGIGSLAVTIAAGTTYLVSFLEGVSQDQDIWENKAWFIKWAVIFNRTSIFLVIASYGLFLAGLFTAYRIFSAY